MNTRSQKLQHPSFPQKPNKQILFPNYPTNSSLPANPHQNSKNYLSKIIHKLEQSEEKHSNRVLKELKRQFDDNVCSVCREIMVAPKKPMILHPCGHNICVKCLFINEKSRQLKISICQQCYTVIDNYAENISLMNIISLYGNKQVQKPAEQQQYLISQTDTSSQIQLINNLRLRCDILEKQRKNISGELSKHIKNKEVLVQVIEKMRVQKDKNEKEMAMVEEQGKLIEKFLGEKRMELEKIKERILLTEEKRRVVDKTLEPLKLQKQKMAVLEAAKLVDNK